MPPEGFVIGLLDSVLEGKKIPWQPEETATYADITVKMIYFRKLLIIVMKKGLSLESFLHLKNI